MGSRREREKPSNNMLTIMRTVEAWSFVSVIAAGQGGNKLLW